MQSFYRLDERERIAECGGDWDRFALDNGSTRSLSKAVQGRPIWDFVEGIGMSSYLGAIFFHVRRTGEGFESSYRCDSPYRARRFRMRTEPCGKGLLLIHCLVWSAVIRDIGEDVSGEGAVSAPRCSVCCRFLVEGAWIDPVADPGRVFMPSEHCVCPDCKAALRVQLAE
ncbi:hypothetical protein [Mangrovicoccus sp. HB161399]|uniref:hypothetical protein n=1 Tax=Mangrovicoccus sp. HB161399 TaxID=2720392 RepID=UPI0015560FD4|nr:hypothetical protein [Mangrovicoccus sp. HB161399]